MPTKNPFKPSVEEFAADPNALQGGQNIVEFDPNRPSNLGEYAAIQEAEPDASTLIPSADMLSARDEILSIVGGFDMMASAFSGGVEPGPLGIENIQGVGIGIRSSAGSYTGEVAVKVFVKEKAPMARLTASTAIPSSVNGVPTDIEEVGELVSQTYKARYPRPVPCGVSCGHFKITAGTIGALVVLDNNRLAILSNNHVLANENNAVRGDNILQPGRIDGGQNPGDLIGVLERFEPIVFPGPNLVDAAAAWTSFALVRADHITYRVNPTPRAPSLNLSVMKNGRTTQATQGLIVGIAVNSVRVAYSGGVALFDNQVIIRGAGTAPFSQGGDSGSLIVSTGTRQPVGLLFAGSATHTIANPIDAVMSKLGIVRFV